LPISVRKRWETECFRANIGVLPLKRACSLRHLYSCGQSIGGYGRSQGRVRYANLGRASPGGRCILKVPLSCVNQISGEAQATGSPNAWPLLRHCARASAHAACPGLDRAGSQNETSPPAISTAYQAVNAELLPIVTRASQTAQDL
jgi:hypothetical protein